MAKINPESLRKVRAQRRLTLDQLAQKARVDKQTIHRLERHQGRRARGNTLERLAEALNVELEVLSQPLSDEGESAWEPNKSQPGYSISDQARNALLLVSERYHVKPAQIFELAPLLFNWAAEKCLQQFDERLEALKAQASKVSDEMERFNVDCSNLLGGPPAPNPLSEFDWAVETGFEMGFNGLFGGPDDEAQPFGDFLDELVSEINETGDEAEFVGWHPNSSPIYNLCKEEAKWLANGDEVAVENILQGYAPLHKMPKDFLEQFRNRNTYPPTDDTTRQRQAAERVAWLRAHGRPDDTQEAVS